MRTRTSASSAITRNERDLAMPMTTERRARPSLDHMESTLCARRPSGGLGGRPNGSVHGDLVGSILSMIRVPADVIKFDAGDGSSSVSERDFRAGVPR